MVQGGLYDLRLKDDLPAVIKRDPEATQGNRIMIPLN
jgi:hypothetical protein